MQLKLQEHNFLRESVALCILVFITLYMFGCKKEEKKSSVDERMNYENTSIAFIMNESNRTKKRLHEYDSPYTVCFDNGDYTYSMYIFSSPIQYEKNGAYKIIENSLVQSSKEGFIFENKENNIKTYFPEKLSDFFRVENNTDYFEFRPNWNIENFSNASQKQLTNMYGDEVNAVIYESKDMDLVFYPTKAGIKSEVVLKEQINQMAFPYVVKSNAVSFENKQNGYIRFLKGDIGEENEINAGIIYKPLVKYIIDGETRIDIQSKLSFYSGKNDSILEVQLNKEIFNTNNLEYPVVFDLSFEMHQEKTPDSSVYSKFETNNFLANYAVVGKHSELGTGWLYSRMYINKFIYLKSEKIISADLHIKNLYTMQNDNPKLEMSSTNEFWSSSRVNWDSRVIPVKRIISPQKSNKFIFDITEFIKEAVADPLGEAEINGNVLCGVEGWNGFSILATSDNSVYTPYIHLIFLK